MARRELGTIRFQDPSRWLVEISLTLLLPTYVLSYVIYHMCIIFGKHGMRAGCTGILTSGRTSY